MIRWILWILLLKKYIFFLVFRILCDDVDSFELNKLLVERFLEK